MCLVAESVPLEELVQKTRECSDGGLKAACPWGSVPAQVDSHRSSLLVFRGNHPCEHSGACGPETWVFLDARVLSVGDMAPDVTVTHVTNLETQALRVRLLYSCWKDN